MRTRATARYIRVPASKARLVLDHIRGKSVGEALATLQYTPKAAGRLIEKVLRSAIANAEHNHQVRNLDDLRVVKAIADGSGGVCRRIGLVNPESLDDYRAQLEASGADVSLVLPDGNVVEYDASPQTWVASRHPR